jgi:hypothetical protein
LGSYIFYIITYFYVSRYAYVIINVMEPSSNYMGLTVAMATILYLFGLGLIAMVGYSRQVPLTILCGIIGFYCLIIIVPDQLIIANVKLPQQAPWIIHSPDCLWAIFAAFSLALSARQFFWMAMESFTSYFRPND